MNTFQKIKSRIKRFVVPALFRCGYYSWLLHTKGRSNRCLILMYHRIGSRNDAGGCLGGQDGISRSSFEKQMQFLREHMTPMPLSVLVKSLKFRRRIPPRAVVVTFDDGYADNYLNAYPVLKKYRIPATIFLATGYISTGRRFWWDQLRAMIRQNPDLPLVMAKKGLLPPEIKGGWFSAGQRNQHELVESLISYIWQHQNMRPDKWIELLEQEIEHDLLPSDDYAPLSWEHVQEMSQHDFDFGSHTVSHPNMVHLSSREVEEELGVSKRTIEQHLGRPVEGFAYPIGRGEHYDSRIKALVQKVGFQYACTAQLGCIWPEKWDIFSLNRISPPSSLPYFVRDISFYLTFPYPVTSHGDRVIIG